MDFSSTEEFFDAVRALISKLNVSGNNQAADEIAEGFSCLNGLTDGWVLLLESLEQCKSKHGATFSSEISYDFEAITKFTTKVVYRKWDT